VKCQECGLPLAPAGQDDWEHSTHVQPPHEPVPETARKMKGTEMADKLQYATTWACDVGGREIWLGILAHGSIDDHEHEPPPVVYAAAGSLAALDYPVFTAFGDSAASAVASMLNS
jgi:hypothetical protein